MNLYREAPIRVSTGLGFFDHMLEQIAKHGGFSLELDCKIETSETAESREFNEILQRDGAKAAIAWRSARSSGEAGGHAEGK